MHFTDPNGNSWTAVEVRKLIAEKAPFRCHGFILACARNDIDHRMTKPNHRWTNGQDERMNRTINSAVEACDRCIAAWTACVVAAQP
jgi:hypothetical protein